MQEIELIPKDVIYKLEIWEAPDGTIHRGSLPTELNGKHFGSKKEKRVILKPFAKAVIDKKISPS